MVLWVPKDDVVNIQTMVGSRKGWEGVGLGVWVDFRRSISTSKLWVGWGFSHGVACS